MYVSSIPPSRRMFNSVRSIVGGRVAPGANCARRQATLSRQADHSKRVAYLAAARPDARLPPQQLRGFHRIEVEGRGRFSLIAMSRRSRPKRAYFGRRLPPCRLEGSGVTIPILIPAQPVQLPLPEDFTPATVKPLRVSLVEPVAYQFQSC